MVYTKRIPPPKYAIRASHSHRPLLLVPETESAPAQAYSGNLRPRPPDIEILSILGWGDASDVPGTDWSRMGISRIASLMMSTVLSIFCGFFVASSCLRSHAQAGPSPGREPCTGLASIESRRLVFGRLPGYRNHPSVEADAESLSPVISLY